MCFLGSDVLQAVHLVGTHLCGILYHALDKVIGVHHCSLAALHLTIGQFHHAIGEVYEVLAPLESQFIQQDGKNLEVIVLLVSHHIDHLVNGEVGEAHLGGADVLRHVDAGAVGAEQQLLVQALVCEVSPHRVVVLAEEQALS